MFRVMQSLASGITLSLAQIIRGTQNSSLTRVRQINFSHLILTPGHVATEKKEAESPPLSKQLLFLSFLASVNCLSQMCTKSNLL